jgi:transcriptional regulator with XRE-family HTH domain
MIIFFCEIGCMISNRNDDYLKALGKHIRKIRTQKELSQEELSDKIGTSPSQIGRIERGVINPTVSTLKVLAEALEVSMQDLFLFDHS